MERFIRNLHSIKLLNLFIINLRILLGIAFIPSGLTKVFNREFTTLTDKTAIGFFFEGLYQSGFYWIFIGLCQLLTAFLLMTQRMATLGAVFFFVIIVNIFIITVSLNFTGTWIITGLMLLAGLLLLVWDWERLKPILGIEISEKINIDVVSWKWQVFGLLLFILLSLITILI